MGRWTIALGGHALSSREALRCAARAIAPLLAGQGGILVHGNGPQVGDLLFRDPELPIDVAVAETQALIGYELIRALEAEAGSHRVVAIVTRVAVDSEGAVQRKPVGPILSREEAERLARLRHWDMGSDPGRGYRRWVPSPRPVRVIEEEAILALAEGGWIVIAGGGGGVPVDGAVGVEAVVDKDWTAMLLAVATRSEMLLFLTSVPCVYGDFSRGARGRPLSRLTPQEARALLCQEAFAEGSMAPKVESACLFVEQTGGRALITDLARLEAALQSRAGTWIEPGP